jgi:hypothetical protein
MLFDCFREASQCLEHLGNCENAIGRHQSFSESSSRGQCCTDRQITRLATSDLSCLGQSVPRSMSRRVTNVTLESSTPFILDCLEAFCIGASKGEETALHTISSHPLGRDKTVTSAVESKPGRLPGSMAFQERWISWSSLLRDCSSPCALDAMKPTSSRSLSASEFC